VAVMTLALGIGVNAMVFTVTKAALFAGFPLVDRNDRILYMTSWEGCCVSYPDFEDWRAQAKSFEGMALVHGASKILGDKSGFAESYESTEVSAGTFQLLGQRPMLGRDFTLSDETPGAPPVAILSYGFWERRYGKDPAIVGQMVRINGVPTAVIGIMTQGFSFPQKQDLWVPLMPAPDVRRRAARDTWFVFGRMAEGVTINSARAEMNAIGRRLESAYPLTNQGFLPIVRNFREFFIGPNEIVLYRSMWGAVGFVLLIACANLANLMLARAIGKSREISVRIALGAGRWRIVRQLLIESMMLSGLGGILGWWIAK
jgi:putative ABC transport system permease protein